jgi:hypothetical protein
MASQPIIDEEALNPPELNLIYGIYLPKSINQKLVSSDSPFMGS